MLENILLFYHVLGWNHVVAPIFTFAKCDIQSGASGYVHRHSHFFLNAAETDGAEHRFNDFVFPHNTTISALFVRGMTQTRRSV